MPAFVPVAACGKTVRSRVGGLDKLTVCK